MWFNIRPKKAHLIPRNSKITIPYSSFPPPPNANSEPLFSMKFQQMVTFHFGGGRGGSKKNGHYFPFSGDIELYLRSLTLCGKFEVKIYSQ